MKEQQIRYRSTQINIVKINGVISAHATIKAEYLLTLSRQEGNIRAVAQLEDSVYDFHTKGSERAAELVRATDTIKKRLVYELNDRGSPVKLLNSREVQQNWRDFKATMSNGGRAEGMDEETFRRFIAAGDAEYNSEELLLKNSGTVLFNKVVFSQYLTNAQDRFDDEIFETQSHFFPAIRFNVHCETKRRGESEGVVHYAKAGKPLFVDKSYMIALYEKFYLSQIGFKFTDYLYDFEAKFDVSAREQLIRTAEVAIRERVKNNLESEVIYRLREVEL